MNKKLKTIIFVIIACVICFFINFIFIAVRYGYDINMRNYKPYFWVFKDSAKINVDTTLFIGCTRKTDVLYTYIYKLNYNVSIWEFKDLEAVKLRSIHINQNVNLDNLKFSSAVVLFNKSSPEITVSYGSFFNNTFDINLDEYSKIERHFEGTNYKGIYCTINRMSLSDEKGKHLVLFDFIDGIEPNIILLYKSSKSFYLIRIDSKTPFDESIINILNLE